MLEHEKQLPQNTEIEYLSDDALLALIERSEADGLLKAPAQLKAETLAAAKAELTRAPALDPKRQFRSYCLRVGLSVAAALLLLLGAGPVGRMAEQAGPALSITMPDLPSISGWGDGFSRGIEKADQSFRSFQNNLSLNHMGEIDHEE